MANITGRRMMAEIDGDFVVFLIGARFNSFHLLKTVLDLGGRRGMKHMLDYLVAHPEKGLLGYQMGLPTIVQYWRSFDHLEAFANDAERPARGRVAQLLETGRARARRTGIWHETYLVRAGEYEAVYGNMPPFGLGKAGRLVPLAEGKTAQGAVPGRRGRGRPLEAGVRRGAGRIWVRTLSGPASLRPRPYRNIRRGCPIHAHRTT